MPLRKKTYRRKRKSRIPKLFSSQKPKVAGGFPSKKMVKLKYAQEITLAGTSAGIVQHQFRCNSVYRPDYTTGGTYGHQPMNFDRWAALYEHYTVISAVLKVTPTDTTNSNKLPGYLGVMVSTDSGGTSQLAYVVSLFENNLNSHKFLQVGNSSAPSRTWGGMGLKSYFNAKRLFGVVNPEDGIGYGASITTNPDRDAYFNVYLASIRGNTPANITALVEIEYTVMFDELITQTQN